MKARDESQPSQSLRRVSSPRRDRLLLPGRRYKAGAFLKLLCFFGAAAALLLRRCSAQDEDATDASPPTTATTATASPAPTPAAANCRYERVSWESCVLESGGLDVNECRSCAGFYLDYVDASIPIPPDPTDADAVADTNEKCRDNADLVCAAALVCSQMCAVELCAYHVDLYATCVVTGPAGCNGAAAGGDDTSSPLMGCLTASPTSYPTITASNPFPFPSPSFTSSSGPSPSGSDISSDRPSFTLDEAFPTYSPGPSSSSGASSSLSPSEPFPPWCAEEVAALTKCFAETAEETNQGGYLVGACTDCFAEFAEAVPFLVCGGNQNQCAAFGACPGCFGCYPERMGYLACLHRQENAGCDSYRCHEVEPACLADLDAFAQCVEVSSASTDSVRAVTACLECLTVHVENVDSTSTCVASEYYTCNAMDKCPECGSCGGEFAAVQNCRNRQQCDPVSCYYSNPPGDGCDVPRDGLRACLADANAAASSSQCEDCVAYKFDALVAGVSSGFEAPSCLAINDELCAALVGTDDNDDNSSNASLNGGGASSSAASCRCGPCVGEATSYLTCRVAAMGGAGCAVACNQAGTGLVPAQQPMTPSPSSSGSSSSAASVLARLAVGGGEFCVAFALVAAVALLA